MLALLARYKRVPVNAIELVLTNGGLESCRALLENGVYNRLSPPDIVNIISKGIDFVQLFHEHAMLPPDTLPMAIQWASIDVVKYLLDAGYNSSGNYRTTLHLHCVFCGRLDALKLVVEHLGITEVQKANAFQAAMNSGSSQIVEYLLSLDND